MIGVSFIAALTVLPVMGAPRMRYDLSARVEGRYREPGSDRLEPPPADSPTEVGVITRGSHAWDLDSEAMARLVALWRRARFSVGYGPRYGLADIGDNTTSALLHRAELLLNLSFPRVELAFSEYATYGQISYAGPVNVQGPQGPQGPPGMSGMSGMQTPPGGAQITQLQPVPAATELDYLSSDSTLSSTIRTSHLTRLILTTGYFVSGGSDAPSRAILPLAQTLRATAAFEVTATRRDTLTTSVEGSEVITSSTAPQWPIEPPALPLPPSALLPLLGGRPPVNTIILRAGETWQRRLTPTATSTLGAGIELVPDSPLDDETHVYPYGSAALTKTWVGPAHSRFAASAGVYVTSLVDRLTGLPDQRWQASADVIWTRRPWSLRAAVSHSNSLDSDAPNALELTSFELTGGYELTRMLTLESGLRMFRQVYPQREGQAPMDPTTPVAAVTRLSPESLRTIVFVALSFHLGERDF